MKKFHAKKYLSKIISKLNSSDENNDKNEIKTPNVKTKSNNKNPGLKETEQLICEHCDYYWKKTAAMNKHMITKHAADRTDRDKQICTCNNC